MNETLDQESSVRTYVIIFTLLMVLMGLTILAAHVHLGEANIIIAMLIAIVKATLVVLFFMHVKYSGKLVWVFAGAAFLWLGIMLVLTLNDYVSRTWVPRRIADQPAATMLRSPYAPKNLPKPMTDVRDIDAVDAEGFPSPRTSPQLDRQ